MAMRQDASTGKMVEVPSEGDADAKPSGVDEKGRPIMAVKVYAPFQVYYEGDALSVSALNETGTFDILPRHHNFLCMLLPCNMIIRTPYDTKVVQIARALMHVKADRVVVFVDV